MPIKENQVLTIHYILKDADGEVLDSTYEDEEGPMEFLTGHDEILPKLEAAILTMTKGSKKKVVLAPEDAYGDYDPENIEVVKKDELPEDIELEIGTELIAEVDDDEDAEATCTISQIEGDEVTLDFNHPLAGQSLYFEVELLDMREATPEELAHGHVHGEDFEE